MAQTGGLTTGRVFTAPSSKAYDQLKWRERSSIIVDKATSEQIMVQQGVEFPEGWSLDSINVVAQQCFVSDHDTAERESSLRQAIDRVVDTVTRQGLQEAYFETDEEAEDFREELKYVLATQRATFSPVVWQNIGVPGRVQKASDCFIVGAEDAVEPVLNWHTDGGAIVGGIGISAATTPMPVESLAKGSEGTYRAAKRIVLGVSHPDIEQFIAYMASEKRKAQILEQFSIDGGISGHDVGYEQYRSAGSSICVTDDFMHAVQGGNWWDLTAAGTKSVVKTVKSRDLLRDIVQAARDHADLSMQFDTTINRWHTTPKAGRINASSPTGGYLHLDNSACNSATINLLAYLGSENGFDVEAFKHTIELIFMAQEILVGYSVYPTQSITKNTKTYRELSLGYTNLAALLMAMGLSYDSDEGRAVTATIAALMTGQAYAVSAKMARRVGPFAGYRKDREAMQNVLRMHRAEVSKINAGLVPEELLNGAATAWDEAVELSELYGVRNSQATAIGSTDIVSRILGCEAVGARPATSLLGLDHMSDGSSVVVVSEMVIRALKNLGYTREQADAIVAHILKGGTVTDAPHLKDGHLDVLACATGERVVHYSAHIKMMSVIQPFLSGAVDEALYAPAEATVDDIEQIYVSAWQAGLKIIAVNYGSHDPAKPALPEDESNTGSNDPEEATTQSHIPLAVVEDHGGDKIVVVDATTTKRRELPRRRRGTMYKFCIAGSEGSATVGEYEDGTPGELMLDVSIQDSSSSHLVDALISSINHGLQHGAPLRGFVEAMMNTEYAPSGTTDDPEVQTASSITDYMARRLALDYLSADDRTELGVAKANDTHEDQAKLLVSDNSVEKQPIRTGGHLVAIEGAPAGTGVDSSTVVTAPVTQTANNEEDRSAPLCYNCGNQTQRAGGCFVCSSCGSTTSFS